MILKLSPVALSQIEDIIEFTDQYFGEAQTQTYVGGLYYTFDLLLDNPDMGIRWEGNRRRYTYRSHYVFYESRQSELIILQVRNTKMAPATSGELE